MERCSATEGMDLFTNDVRILSWECDGEWGAFIAVLLVTAAIKIGQNVIYANQAQIQRELMQMTPPERKRGGIHSKMAKMLWYEFLGTVTGILSVLVIMGANMYIFLVILLSNLGGTYMTYKDLHKDQHSVADDVLSLVKWSQKKDDNCTPSEDAVKIKHAQYAVEQLKAAMFDTQDTHVEVLTATNNKKIKSMTQRVGLVF